jgi:dipeptidyl aminopeptidase/acylaminoacyl peptidase
MSLRWGHVAAGAAAVAAALGLAIAVSTVGHSYQYVHPRRARVTDRERQEARARLPGLEDVELQTRDGLVLRGWFAPGSRRDAVVLVHGLTDSRCQLLPEAEILSSHGHGVLLFDSRASGESGGEVATWGDRERLDIAAALDLLSARPDVDPKRLGAYGISVGASAVALAAAQDARIQAVLLGPVWPSLEAELGEKGGRFGRLSAALARLAFEAFGVDVAAVRPVDAIRAIPPRPLMLISGSADDDTPPAIMEVVHRAVPSASWWLVPGAGHGHFGEAAPVEYPRRLAAFFDENLTH